MKGTYILIINLPDNITLSPGKLGSINFLKGYYAYVGSAMNGLENRIDRHLRNNKKMFWHIDYLLKKGDIKRIYYEKNDHKLECEHANKLSSYFTYIPNFGSSDCNCKSHLFYTNSEMEFYDVIEKSGFVEYHKY